MALNLLIKTLDSNGWNGRGLEMIPSWLSLVDVMFVVVVLMFAWGGYQKGFASQVAHVLTSVCGGLLLFLAYPRLFDYFGRVFRRLEEAYLMWLLLAVVALVLVGLFMLFSRLVAAVIKAGISDSRDAGLGLVLGFFRGILFALIMMIMLVMLDRTGRSYDFMRVKSYVGRWVCYDLVPHVQPRLTTLYENRIQDLKNKLLEQDDAASDIEI